jgi:uncharacterized Zn-binding protein involved in type VI secretion
MGSTVFAEGMGLFHKGSGGKGVAPADTCLTPPPPPGGPAPVPYVNNLSAADLAKGSKTVMIQGEPTALEDQSEIATSTGDEAGTQGGNVITHKTKGKGYFQLWSFAVKIEGKGVCRHGDPMGQNCASLPPGCVDASAVVNVMMLFGFDRRSMRSQHIRPLLSRRLPQPCSDAGNSEPPAAVLGAWMHQCRNDRRPSTAIEPGLDSRRLQKPRTLSRVGAQHRLDAGGPLRDSLGPTRPLSWAQFSTDP